MSAGDDGRTAVLEEQHRLDLGRRRRGLDNSLKFLGEPWTQSNAAPSGSSATLIADGRDRR
jgi:hypothetical protein